MNFKNPKFIGSIIAIILAVVGAVVGLDLKGAVCSSSDQSVMAK